MLDLVKDETERIGSRFFEPSFGNGNFLESILRRKLAAVELKYGKSKLDKRHYALFGLMCIYGVELLADNIAECRERLLKIFSDYLGLSEKDNCQHAARYVLTQNLIHGNTLAMQTHDKQPILFAEWGYVGAGRYLRRDFRFEDMLNSPAQKARAVLLSSTKTYQSYSISDLAGSATDILSDAYVQNGH